MAPIPKQFIKEINSGKFPKGTKKYFVNMTSNSKKLHITNCKNAVIPLLHFDILILILLKKHLISLRNMIKIYQDVSIVSKKIKVI